MFKAVLFDLDGTLIDFMRMKREAVSAAIAGEIPFPILPVSLMTVTIHG